MRNAIDIVLIPPSEIQELCINLNSNLSGNENIFLNSESSIPHISLLMGVITLQSGDVVELRKGLEEMNRSLKPIEININHLKTNEFYTGLHIEITPELEELQDELINKFSKLLTYDATIKDFADPENIKEKSTKWVNGFIENSTGENFDPHITIGDGSLNKEHFPELPITFEVDKLHIYQLGNYCTCHTKLL